MKKFITILIILTATNFILSAADYQSSNDGDWNVDGNWDISPYPQTTADNVDLSNNITVPSGVSITINNLTVNNNNTLTIIGDLSVYDLIINNNFTLIVTGTLTVRNNVTLNNNSTLGVSGTGSVAVTGNFTFSNNADAVIDGALTVGGTLSGSTSSNTITGTEVVTATTYSGTGSLFGTAFNDPVLVGGTSYKAGTGSAVPLPIELAFFNAYKTENNITLIWQTATEKNNDYFTLERSKDGLNYEIIGTVIGAGNSMTARNYNFVDNNPINGISYYRLTQTDYDGAFEVFSPISVSYINEGDLKVGPNPAISQLNVSMSGEMGSGLLKLYSVTGAIVKSLEMKNNHSTIDINDLPTGTYMMVISAGQTNISRRIYKQ